MWCVKIVDVHAYVNAFRPVTAVVSVCICAFQLVAAVVCL